MIQVTCVLTINNTNMYWYSIMLDTSVNKLNTNTNNIDKWE